MEKKDYDKGRRLAIRLTEDEKRLVFGYAKQDRLSISDYIKQMALKKAVVSNRVEYTTDLRNLNFELNRIGNNINQMAKHFNSKKEMDTQDFKAFQGMMAAYLEKMMVVERQLKLMYSKLAKV